MYYRFNTLHNDGTEQDYFIKLGESIPGNIDRVGEIIKYLHDKEEVEYFTGYDPLPSYTPKSTDKLIYIGELGSD